MEDPIVSALEGAVSDLGTLLVQAEKFRAGHADEARALRTAALAVGDRARRAHRDGVLDAPLAQALAAEAAAARAGLVACLARIRSGAPYREAAAALAANDRVRLAEALSRVFDGVSAVTPPSVLHHAVAWQRRGRPRSALELAEEIATLLAAGLPGDDEVEAPGVDRDLPGVLLQRAPPPGDPVYLAIDGADLPSPVIELATTRDVVVTAMRLRVPFRAVLARPDDDAEGDAWVLDPAAFARDLAAALAARGVPVEMR